MPENRIISPDEAIAALLGAQENDGLSQKHIAQLADIVNLARGPVDNTFRVVKNSLPDLEVISRLNLDNQYGEVVDRLKYYGFINPDATPKLGDATMPTLDRIKQAFGYKKLDIAQSYPEPRLVIYSDMPFQEQIRILQDSKFGFVSVYADAKFNDATKKNGAVRHINKWGASIVNAVPIAEETDRVSLERRLDRRCAELQQFEGKMTKGKALMLMLDAMRNGISMKQFTVLLDGEKSPVNKTQDGREAKNEEILFGFCDTEKKQICFNLTQTGGCISGLNFYSSVDADL